MRPAVPPPHAQAHEDGDDQQDQERADCRDAPGIQDESPEEMPDDEVND